MSSFPKWLYHAAQAEPVLVRSTEEERALPPGWADSPAAALEFTQTASSSKPKKRASKITPAEGPDA